MSMEIEMGGTPFSFFLDGRYNVYCYSNFPQLRNHKQEGRKKPP
jgi:hypothetical protein